MGIDEKNTNEPIKADAFVRRMPSHRNQRPGRRPSAKAEQENVLTAASQEEALQEAVEETSLQDTASETEVSLSTDNFVQDTKENAAEDVEIEVEEVKVNASEEKTEKKSKTQAKKSENAFTKFIKNHKPLAALILLLLLIIIIVVVLVAGGGAKKSARRGSFMDQIRNQEIKENDVAAIDDFFVNYYTAVSSGNTTDLEAMFDDPSKANITTEVSTIVSQYDNFKVYVTPGIEENDIVAFVSYDIHFDNIEATAPSVDSFYLKYDSEQAALKICSDMYTDQEILKFMNLVSYREPIRSLLTDTNNRLSDALAGNKDLNNLYILMQSITESADYSGKTESESVTETETTAESESESETENTEG